jgi:hypothetical protein
MSARDIDSIAESEATEFPRWEKDLKEILGKLENQSLSPMPP